MSILTSISVVSGNPCCDSKMAADVASHAVSPSPSKDASSLSPRSW